MKTLKKILELSGKKAFLAVVIFLAGYVVWSALLFYAGMPKLMDKDNPWRGAVETLSYIAVIVLVIFTVELHGKRREKTPETHGNDSNEGDSK